MTDEAEKDGGHEKPPLIRKVDWALEIALRGSILLFLIAGTAALMLYVSRLPAQDVPWGELHLEDGVGLFTAPRLAALSRDPEACLAALDASSLAFVPVEPRDGPGACGWTNGVRITRSNTPYSAPSPLIAACPLAAAIYVWEREVLIPAALEHLGSAPAEILQSGVFSCRRVGGGATGRLSEHARANAIDIHGVRLEDGRVIRVLAHWDNGGPEGDFLRDVRDGACRVFRAVLSPDYNAAHADHFHFEMGRWSQCS